MPQGLPCLLPWQPILQTPPAHLAMHPSKAPSGLQTPPPRHFPSALPQSWDPGTASYPSPSSLVREDRSFITAIPYVFTLKRHPRRRQSGDTLSPHPRRIPLPEGILACPWLSPLIYGESSEPVRHPR